MSLEPSPAADPLAAILVDLDGPDSAIMADVVASLARGASVDEATTRARTGVAFALLREVRPIIRGLAAAGESPGAIRAKALGALARMPDPGRHRGFLGAVLGRALDEELGPAPGGESP